MTPALSVYIKSWMDKAENDLLSAQRLLEIEPMILDNACFHCQQAIEKYLKAFLIYQGVDVERTHNIIYLLSKCTDFDPEFRPIDPLNINAYAVQGRYPDTNLMPEKDEADGYYKLALQIKALIYQKVTLAP
jgi:HEPN domain-containing protein